MKNRMIVLDFDGTIADSEQTILKIYQDFASQSKLPKLTNQAYRQLRSGKPKDALRWAGVRFWQLPKLLRLGRTAYQLRQDEIKIFPYMAEVVEELVKKGEDVYILSSNSKETVQYILSKNKMDKNITILKGSSIFGKHKMLSRLLREKGYEPSDSWMIGDEVRDIQAGQKSRMNTIGVAWGLQDHKALVAAQPTSIAAKPHDILNTIYRQSRTAK